MRNQRGITAKPRKVWLARVTLAAGIAVALMYLPYRVLDGPEAERLRPMREELRHKQSEISKLNAENRELRVHIEALRNDSTAIEIIAREDLGMVYPDELVITVQGDSEAPQ